MINEVSSLEPLNAQPSESRKLKDSAQQFEALLIGQMLKSARESGGSWFGTGEDEASSATAGFAEEQFAQTIASQGGLGIASMLVQGLAADQQRIDARSEASVIPPER